MYYPSKRAELLPSVGAATLLFALVAGVAGAQDQGTINTMNQPQNNGALTPPNPPQPGQSGLTATPPQGGQSGLNNSSTTQERSMMSGQSAAMQNGRDQTMPQPPDRTPNMNQSADRQAGGAELGVFLVPTDGAGVRIRSVTPGAAAEAAGVREGDVLLAVNGQTVAAANDVIQRIRSLRPGDNVELRIWRNGAEQTLAVTLKEAQRVNVQASGGMSPSSDYIANGVVEPYYSGQPVYRQYNYSPGYYGYGYSPGFYGNGYGRGYGYGNGYRGQYYGTPGFGYSNSPWGQSVRVGQLRFGWR